MDARGVRLWPQLELHGRPLSDGRFAAIVIGAVLTLGASIWTANAIWYTGHRGVPPPVFAYIVDGAVALYWIVILRRKQREDDEPGWK